MKLSPTAKDEREYEKRHIARKKRIYLSTDVLEREKTDIGYSKKIALIEGFLNKHDHGGYVLDIGSNTAGEAEILSHRGYRMVATDINEIALSYSKIRSKNFRDNTPVYVAADAHRMPFADATFDNAIAYEVLHHLEQLNPALNEIFRVLRGGGKLFAFEPYALNPYRRLAELRFYRKGSIERSFTANGLKRQLENAGFKLLSCEKQVLPPSEWNMKQVSGFRRFLKKLYYKVSRQLVLLFGSLVVIAEKPGEQDESLSRVEDTNLEAYLRCPCTGCRLERRGDSYVTSDEGSKYRYRFYEGVPVLIKEDAVRVEG